MKNIFLNIVLIISILFFTGNLINAFFISGEILGQRTSYTYEEAPMYFIGIVLLHVVALMFLLYIAFYKIFTKDNE